MSKKYIRQYGDCKVTLSFDETCCNTVDNVMWLLIESYADRVGLQIEEQEQQENDIAS